MGGSCFESRKNRVDLKPEYIQQIMEENADKGDQIASLKKENTDYKTKNSNLKAEIKQLKNMCSQYQLMLQYQNNNLNQNNQNAFNNNNNNFNQNDLNNGCFNNNINTFNNNQIICGNNNMYNFCTTFKNKIKNSRIITIIFIFDGGLKYTISTFSTCRLMDVFSLVINRNKEYQDLTRLSFHYNSINITSHFLNNDEVDALKLPNNCMINVDKIKNVS